MNNPNLLPFAEHLDELRIRVWQSVLAFFGVTVVCLADQRFYLDIVLLPHMEAMRLLHLPTTIQVLRYEESFFCHLKVAMIASMILSMPFFIYQLWCFVATGLYETEKKYVRAFFPITVIFFLIGVMFGYFVLVPLGLQFLGSYGAPDVQIGFTLSSYISLFFALTFVCGMIFELPLVMVMARKLNLLTSEFYIRKWRQFVLGAFIFAAIATPPDAVTQILMAGPIISLYFFGILLCRIMERFQEIKQFLSE